MILLAPTLHPKTSAHPNVPPADGIADGSARPSPFDPHETLGVVHGPIEGTSKPGDLPRISPVLLRVFRWYARRFIARHFHAVRLAGGIRIPPDAALVVYCNHASWWDPMMLLLLGDRMVPGRRHYAPVDAEAIERYRLFKRMGFFGVEQGQRRGAVRFLRISEAILRQPLSVLWLTPQGRFSDVRERPVQFQRGLGTLAARARRTLFLPLAMEYTFWEERLPEALLLVGKSVWVEEGAEFDAWKWVRLFEQALRETQERLAGMAIRRQAQAFETVLSGNRGVNPFYDTWRAVTARLRGEPFQKEHGSL